MKLNLLFSPLLLILLVKQGESTITRDAAVKILDTINTASYKLANVANNYLLEQLKNESQIQEWSVNIQVAVATGLAKAAFSAIDVLSNTSTINPKVLNCIADQETPFLEALTEATTKNGWCSNRLAANLTYAFQEVTEQMVIRNTYFRQFLDSFSGCTYGDDLCFTQYLASIRAYFNQEHEADMEAALEKVTGIYKIMFGEDVPACAGEYFLPELAETVHGTAKNVFACAIS